jgi:hypothetical protein
MAFQTRSAILEEIGSELQAGVLAYVTGDRENLETEVSADVLQRVPRHLEAIGKQERLALGALTALVTRLTTELYSHSHLITRTEAKALGLPVELPSERLESGLLAYYEQLKADLELLEKFDRGALRKTQDKAPIVLERAYIETASTCDVFVTRATPDLTSDRWETVAP